MEDAVRHCRDFVRHHDMDAYLATLLAPQKEQFRLFAIWAIAVDALRLPWSTSEPAMAMIRLQWWRDALEAGGGHPALAYLEKGNVSPLIRFLNAAERLHGAPFARAADAEAWAHDAFVPLAEVLTGTGEVAHGAAELATLHGLVLLLRRASFPRRSGLPLLSGAGGVCEVRRHAQGNIRSGSVKYHPALLTFSLSRKWLRLMKNMKAEDLLKVPPEFPQWRRQLFLLQRHLMRRP